MTGDIPIPPSFRIELIRTLGSFAIAAALIRTPTSTLRGWLDRGRWPATKKELFYQLQNYVQQPTAERI